MDIHIGYAAAYRYRTFDDLMCTIVGFDCFLWRTRWWSRRGMTKFPLSCYMCLSLLLSVLHCSLCRTKKNTLNRLIIICKGHFIASWESFFLHFRPQGREFWIVKREKGNGKRKNCSLTDERWVVSGLSTPSVALLLVPLSQRDSLLARW